MIILVQLPVQAGLLMIILVQLPIQATTSWREVIIKQLRFHSYYYSDHNKLQHDSYDDMHACIVPVIAIVVVLLGLVSYTLTHFRRHS